MNLKRRNIKSLRVGDRVCCTAPNGLIGRTGTILRPEPHQTGDSRMFFVVGIGWGKDCREFVIAAEHLDPEI